jgi:membrane-bound serine protease (ClpP class)
MQKNRLLPAALSAVVFLLISSSLFARPALSNVSCSRPFIIRKLGHTEINRWYHLYLRKCLAAARSHTADLLILELDTPGGRVDTTLKIISDLADAHTNLVVYINKNAISAGALISLTGRTIFMHEGSVIGASAPIIMDKNKVTMAPEKMVSALRAEFRAQAQRHGRSARICEAMVDKETVLTKSRDGIDLPADKLLTLSHSEALQLGISDYTVSSLTEVCAILGIQEDALSSYEISDSLQLLGVLSSPVLLGVLMTIGILGLVFEVRTPGWGVGGTIAVIFLSAFFIIQIGVENSGWMAPALFLLGLVLLILEFFVIPGFGIAGVTGMLLILSALFLSFGVTNWRTAMNTLALSAAAVAIGTLLIFRFLPDSGVFRRLTLEAPADPPASPAEQELAPGQIGTVISDLHPVGKAEIAGEIYEVSSDIGYIDKGVSIRIHSIQGRLIVVRTHNPRTHT